MAYSIGISCNGVLPLNYHWTVTEDQYDQREGIYGVVVASGDTDTEVLAQQAAEYWCDQKFSIGKNKLNRHYAYHPRS